MASFTRTYLIFSRKIHPCSDRVSERAEWRRVEVGARRSRRAWLRPSGRSRPKAIGTVDTSSNSSSNSSSSSDTVGQQFISTHIQFDIFDKKVNDLVSSLTVDFDIPSLDVNEVTTHNNDKYGDLVCAFSLILGCSFIDLDKILMDIMDLTGIRQDEWDAVRLTTRGPKRNRSIKVLGPLCYHQTRFSQMELERLKTLFFWQGSY